MDRIVVFMNGTRGLSVVRALGQAGHSLSAIVVPSSLPDTMEIDSACRQTGAELWREPDVNAQAFIARLKTVEPRVAVVAGFSTILRKAAISVPEHGTLNLHAGRLPQYRGGSPLNWQIINGERQAGISVIKLDEGIDTGDVLAATEIDIGPEDTIAALHERANHEFPRLVVSVLNGIENKTVEARRQDETQAAYWHQRNDDDGRLLWNEKTAVEAHRFVRALTRPYPGAFCYRSGERIRVLGVRLPDFVLRGMPGRVCRIMGQGTFVVCKDRALLVTDARTEAGTQVALRHGERLN